MSDLIAKTANEIVEVLKFATVDDPPGTKEDVVARQLHRFALAVAEEATRLCECEAEKEAAECLRLAKLAASADDGSGERTNQIAKCSALIIGKAIREMDLASLPCLSASEAPDKEEKSNVGVA